MTERTKQCKRNKIIFSILHYLAMLAPIIYFAAFVIITGEVVQKVAMTIDIIVVLILGVLSLFTDVKYRGGLRKTMLWAMIAGIVWCLNRAHTFIIIMAICSILDELIFVKLKDRYAELTRTNKELDRRE